jgi:hypothetical protein
MEAKATDAPVELRITTCLTCKHDVEYQEGQQNAKHADELQKGSGRHIAVLLLSDRLDQSGNHNTDAEEVTEIGKVDIKIPTDRMDVVEDSETCNAAYKAECAVHCLENELCGSVFDHDGYSFFA